ncbi:hypothetical protein LTR70_008681 [Exophiala xenobiotica]|uniref:Uncharacterized protein n=1 Tax=Lithohypha guttulata TaxID=1690604 RepID=A0ABR0K3J6_9EURO|nr:hypothetical protein LTR24_007229 [Lithohypha guttulata]KAK5311584.1 hypothetical protein LTR70_008681 [Exophiala xenobiotica]
MRIPALAAVGLFYLGLSALFYLLFPGQEIDPGTFDALSGFYGPGSCCAWLLLILSNTEFKMCYTYFRRVFRGDLSIEDNDHHRTKVDAAIVGSVAYPFVAFVDFVRRGETYHGYETTDAAIYAQVSIAQLAAAASKLAIAVLCFPPIYVSSFRLSLGAQMLEAVKILDILCIVWVAGWTAFEAGEHKTPDLAQKAVALLGVGSFLLSAVSTASLIASLSLGTNKMSSVRFAFPRSSAKLTDLDQAAALAIAVFTLVLSIIKAARTRTGTSHGIRSHESGMGGDIAVDEAPGHQDFP